jgi:vitamin B12 transporter
MPALPIDTDQIVITASRSPVAEAQSPASVTIIDSKRIERLGEPLVASMLRLTPSAAVATSGPAGSLTEVRIRGAEANHTLLFVDGIQINDPASGDTPRFEILNADLASRIEVIRGPQSALWGSEAIGGVIAINGVDDATGTNASAEGGSFGFARAAASAAIRSRNASLAGAVGWQRATGVDSFGAPHGDKDGYRNLSGRVRGTYAVGSSITIGASAIALTGRSQFDGYDPLTFEHTDTLDSSRNRLDAGRIWAQFGDASSAWSGRVAVSALGSSNRNLLDDHPVNRTKGSRRNLEAQVERQFATGSVQHEIIVAGDSEKEEFHARGTISDLSTDQDRSRRHNALTAEWRASSGRFTADAAIRHDFFSRFRDATALRLSALANLGAGFAIAGSYAEGIAQPTFFDLYGTFPNNFVGNPNLKPESSKGFEASLRFRRSSLEASLTGYRQRLHDEIVDVFEPVTFLFSTTNSEGTSHRWGVEAELGWRIADQLRLTANYDYLHSTQPSSGSEQVTELRRPKHRGAISADGSIGRWSYGASIAYAGSHLDREEVLPFGIVRVDRYWLAGARVAYALSPNVELFVRGANLFDAKYQEVAGYHTEGLGGFAGIRLGGRRSSP